MKAFLLAAGFGERLRPLTERVPKSLVPVAGIPVICYALAMLKEAGISDIMCNVHYRHEDVMDFFAGNDSFGMNVSFSIEDSILGTGGGLKKCQSWFGEDDFIIINSDIICDLELSRVITAHHEGHHPGTIVLYPWKNDGPAPVAVQGDRVVDFKKALGSPVEPAWDYMGIALLSPMIFPYLSFEFSSVVYTGYTSLVTHHSLGYTGTPESLAAADKLLLSERKDLPEKVRQVLGTVK
ncbi:MAG: nucleotidyl transferase [Spirochaetae bacterium HGW-Spirochaetae-1]|nr:MAG: nucleotidyl transferase [Spirochaetae bacterium HGW-Spirochaetae-1]